MNFTVITHVAHINEKDKIYGYSPYVREMNIWLKHVESFTVVAPLSCREISPIDSAYNHDNIIFREIPGFSITSINAIFKTVLVLPYLFFVVFMAMKKADHIHLRCPGNVGLIGTIVQILFPKKKKTAKYAGNWDPNSKQPISYRLQRWILRNTFLTRNMQVLVYGNWPNETSNVKPFFTATYNELEKKTVIERRLDNKINFLFVGTLSEGKRPLYAIKLVEGLYNLDIDVELELFGDGFLNKSCLDYLQEKRIDYISLKGNRSKEEVKEALQTSHFLILPSKSEGWPKVVAESMFWGCVPIATKVSCVPHMLGDGERGVLLDLNIDVDIKAILRCIKNQEIYSLMSHKGVDWSRRYTMDYFEEQIKLLLC